MISFFDKLISRVICGLFSRKLLFLFFFFSLSFSLFLFLSISLFKPHNLQSTSYTIVSHTLPAVVSAVMRNNIPGPLSRGRLPRKALDNPRASLLLLQL